VKTYRISFNKDSILCINPRALFLDLIPRPVADEIFTPPRESFALLRTYLIDGALLMFIEVNTDSIFFPAFENITAIVCFASISLQPLLH
jgi:hypothetical protein